MELILESKDFKKSADILIHIFSDLLKSRGASEPESIIFAANFVSEMTDEEIEMELSHVTIH